jgi:hypothetical protein
VPRRAKGRRPSRHSSPTASLARRVAAPNTILTAFGDFPGCENGVEVFVRICCDKESLASRRNSSITWRQNGQLSSSNVRADEFTPGGPMERNPLSFNGTGSGDHYGEQEDRDSKPANISVATHSRRALRIVPAGLPLIYRRT